MTNLEKSDKFDSISESFKNKAEIKPDKQGCFIILPCGCRQRQNFLCNRLRKNESNNHFSEHQSIAFQFFEFCPTHN